MKKVIIVIGVLLAVLLVTAVALPFFVDLNRFKGPIVDQIEGALNREVSLGDIKLTILSGLGAEINDLAVNEGESFAQVNDKFVELSSLKVRLAFLPLLSRKIEVKRLDLDRPRIHLGRSEDGAWSFSDIVGPGSAEEAAEVGEKTEAGPGALAGLLVSMLSIRDGSVTMDDRTASGGKGAPLTVDRIDLDVSGLALDSPVKIDLAARLPGGDEQNVKINGTVGPVPESLDPAKVGMDVRLRLSPLDPSVLAGAMALAPSLSLEDLKVMADLHLQGELGSQVKADGTIGLGPLDMEISGTVKNPMESPVLDARISAPSIPLDELASLPLLRGKLPDDLRPSGALSLSAKASGSLDDLAAELSLSAPEITFVRPAGESGEKRSEGRLRGLKLDASARTGEDLSANGSLRAERADLDGLTIEEIATSFRAEGDTYSLDSLSLRLCSGTMEGSARIAMPGGVKPSWKLESKTDGIDVNQLLSAASELDDVIHGSFRSDLKISGEGIGGEEILRTVNGSGEAKILGVKIANFNLGDAVMDQVTGVPAVSKLASAGGKKVAGHQETSFDSLDASFALGDEKITLDHLTMHNMGTSKATGADAVFSGTIGLDTSLDLKGQLILSQKHSVELVRKFKESKALANPAGRIVFPMVITGEVSSPRPKVDIKYISKAMLKYGGKKLLEDALDVEIPEGEGKQKPLEGILKELIEKEKAKKKKKREKKKK